jgi:molybdate transport system regulatory protein
MAAIALQQLFYRELACRGRGCNRNIPLLRFPGALMPKNPKLRFRVDFSPECSIGIGKIEILEGIARCGSLSGAAREMGMSYRRAWLLLEDLNSGFDEPVTRASVGGRGGGGVVLTSFGERLVEGYRQLESRMQRLTAQRLQDFGRHAKTIRPRRTLPVVSISGQRQAKTAKNGNRKRA